MNVCFDLDHTLVDFVVPWWVIANENAGLKLPREEWHNGPAEWIDGKSFKAPGFQEECNKLFASEWFMIGASRLKRGAYPLLQYLAGNGHNIYIVTARHTVVRDATRDWVLQTLYPFIEDVVFTEHKAPKLPVLKQLNARFWVDDKISDVLDANAEGIKTFICDAPWNRELVRPDIIRIHDMPSLEAYFRMIA